MTAPLANLIELADRAGLDELQAALVSDLASVSFPEFIYHAWPVLHEEAEEPLIWKWYLDCLGEHLQAVLAGDIQWLIVNIPPGFAKSLVCSVLFPAWVWLHKPWWRFLCSGTNEPLTLRDARRHKMLVSSDWYTRTFLPDWRINRAQAADTNFANTRHGVRLSRTVSSSVTGDRPHCRVLDDANDPEKTNPEEFGRVNHWIEFTLLKRRANPRSPLVSFQQRIHQNDATAFLLSRANMQNTVHLVLPNRYTPARAFVSYLARASNGLPWTDQRTEEDELLNEAVQSKEDTERDRKNPALDEAQNQQNPTPEGGIIFTREMFRRWAHEANSNAIEDWESEPPTFPTWPLPADDSWDFVFFTADFNNLKKQDPTKGTDYAVIQVWGVSEGNLYLIKEVREKVGVAASVVLVKDLIEQYDHNLARILIESKANGPTVINALRAVTDRAQEAELPRKYQFIRDWNVQGETKEQRARACVHVAEGGQVFIPWEGENGEIAQYWLPEVTGFPNRTRDDRVDCLTMALTYFDRHPDGG